MEVKIGIQHAAREIALESAQTPDEVVQAVEEALGKGGAVLQLSDEKGRRVIVPADKLAYVEIGEPVERRVGFGAL